MQGTFWTSSDLKKLKVMYGDRDISDEQLLAAFPNRTINCLRQRAHFLGVRRPKRTNVSPKAHPLIGEFARLADESGVCVSAICAEAGLGPNVSYKWTCAEMDPRITAFDKSLRELGMRLAIVPDDTIGKNEAIARAVLAPHIAWSGARRRLSASVEPVPPGSPPLAPGLRSEAPNGPNLARTGPFKTRFNADISNT